MALFIAGAAASVVFAYVGARWIARAIPAEIRPYLPDHAALSMDARALLYTLAVGAVTGVYLRFAPALTCRRIDVNRGLKEGVFRAAGSRFRNLLIVAEVSLALVVLIASGLLVNGLLRMYAAETGFNPRNVVTATVALTKARPGAESLSAPAFFEPSGRASPCHARRRFRRRFHPASVFRRRALRQLHIVLRRRPGTSGYPRRPAHRCHTNYSTPSASRCCAAGLSPNLTGPTPPA